MSERLLPILAFLSALGAGLTTGTWFAFSVFVMAGLARIPAAQGIAAMQSINITVINPLFMAAFGARAVAEEHMLRQALAGYDDYARRVPFRLIPGVW